MLTDLATAAALHIVTFWVVALSFLAADLYWRAHGITKYKLLGSDRPFASNEAIWKAIKLTLLNQFISLPFICFLTMYCSTPVTTSTAVATVTPWQVIWHYVIYIFLADQWFYWTHRAMHKNKFLFAKIHAIHHEWSYPMSIRTMYSHPLEHLVSNLGCVFIGPLLFPMPIWWVHLWGLLALVNSVMAHSGTKYFSYAHDIHHRKLLHNFGVLGFSDWMYGTAG